MAAAAQPSTLHICAADEHIPKIERSIRTIKERCRTICHTLPFKSMPKVMTVALAHVSVHWINAFPSSGGVSDKYSPSSIILGSPLPDSARKRIPFGSYVYAYTGTDNTMDARATPVIALYEGTDDRSYHFMSLKNGKKFHSRRWEILPFTEDMISTVENMTTTQVDMPDGDPVFEWSPGLYIDDTTVEQYNKVDPEDSVLHPDIGGVMENNVNIHDGNVVSDDDASIHNDETNSCEGDHSLHHNIIDSATINTRQEDDIVGDGQMNPVYNQTYPDEEDTASIYTSSTSDHDSATDDKSDDSSIHSSDFSLNMNNYDTFEDNDEQDHPDDQSTQHCPSQSFQHDKTITAETDQTTTNNRPRRQNAGAGVERLEVGFGGKEYVSCQSRHLLMKRMTGVILAQMSAYKGFHKHGERAIAASFKELK